MSLPESRKVIVTGASSLVARYLLPKLVHAGFDVTGISRRGRPEWIPVSCTWQQDDIATVDAERWIRPGHDIVNLAPLPLLAERVARLQTARVVAFSTTSVITKQDSADPGERRLMGSIRTAETNLLSGARSAGIACAVLRPTMIYDGLNDKNVARLRRFIRKYGFLPVAGKGAGIRQPVHAGDLAKAVVDLLDPYSQVTGIYEVSGGERLTYRELVLRLFELEHRRPRIIDLPTGVLRMAARLARLAGPGMPSPAFIDRMAMDMSFDHSSATLAFGYAPRGFQPGEVQE